jgi:Bacterial Ig domain
MYPNILDTARRMLLRRSRFAPSPLALLVTTVTALTLLAASAAAGTASTSAGSGTRSTEATLSASLAPSQGALFGIWSGPPRNGRKYGEEVPYLERLIGRKFDLDRMYYAWDEAFPGWHERDAVAAGRIAILSWLPRTKSGTKIRWAAIANGYQDGAIRARADAVKSFGHKVMVIFHHEPEAEAGTYGTPAEFRAAWRRIVSIYRSRGATNAVWVLNLMSWTFKPNITPTQEEYYPGDDVVDWIAADGYNWYGNTYNPGPWRSFTEIFGDFHSWGKWKGKPLMVAEWGGGEDPADGQRKANWLKESAATLKAWPEIKAVIYFNSMGWDFNSSSPSTNAFAEIGRDPYLNHLEPPPADTSTPTVAIAAPAASQTVAGTVTVTADANDNMGVAKVVFLVNGAVRATDTTAPYSYALDTLELPNGGASLEARASDAAGNVGASGRVDVTVANATPRDSVAPLVQLTSPADGATVARRSVVPIAATASDDVGVVKVEFWANGIRRCTDSEAPYRCDWQVWTASGFVNYVRATAYDASGNIRSAIIRVTTA